LIVVDNDSADGSADAVRQRFPEATVLEMGSNLGFAVAANRGAEAGRAPFILLLNNDARLRAGALARLRDALDADRVAAAGPRLVDENGNVELSLGRTLSLWNEAGFKLLGALYRSGRGPVAGIVKRYYDTSRTTGSLSGACILFERAAFEEAGGFDERFFLYAEDVDLCRRLRQSGWELSYVHDAVVEHARGASSAVAPTATARHYRRSQLAFYRKHRGMLATGALRLYLAFRFALAWLFGRGESRARAAALLRDTARGSGS
jgi:GT2 family glycosyltransferase